MPKLYLGDQEVSPVVTIEKKDSRIGLSLDNFIGQVSDSGELSAPDPITELDLGDTFILGPNALSYRFYYNKAVKSVTAPNLQSIMTQGAQNAFASSTVTTISFPRLMTVDTQGMMGVFQSCTSLTTCNFPRLVGLSSDGMYMAFYGCSNITDIKFPNLRGVESRGLYQAFYSTKVKEVEFKSLNSLGSSSMQNAFGYSSLEKISFPALKEVAENAFSGGSYGHAFPAATKEIHFPAAIQSTIEGLLGYDKKFGATNATIYFDL